MARTGMTIYEAERILDLMSAALQDESHPYGQHPISALQGYDIRDILTALKLRIANEFLQLVHRSDFEERFAEGLKLYDSIPWQIMRSFVADDQVGQIGAKPVVSAVDPTTMQLDKRFTSMETALHSEISARALAPKRRVIGSTSMSASASSTLPTRHAAISRSRLTPNQTMQPTPKAFASRHAGQRGSLQIVAGRSETEFGFAGGG